MKILGFVYLLIVVFVAGGWGTNLYKLVQLDFESPYKAEFIRSIGVLPPIGMFVGWMTIGEEDND